MATRQLGAPRPVPTQLIGRQTLAPGGARLTPGPEELDENVRYKQGDKFGLPFVLGPFGYKLVPKEYLVTSPLPKDRLPPEPPVVLEDAEIRWGKASQYSYGSRQGPHLTYKVTWDRGGDDDEEEEPEQEIPTLTYTELEAERKVSTIRVTSNQDPEIWVDVERIDEVTFQGPASLADPTIVNHKYVLRHPPG